MTALCGGGASSLNAGLPGLITLTSTAIGGILQNSGSPWAVPLSAALGLITDDFNTLCTTDPPGYPTWSVGDYALLLSPVPLPGRDVALQKLSDQVETYLWYQMCHCNSTTTPARPAAPAAPADAPTLNPPSAGPSYPTGLPCFTADFHINSLTSSPWATMAVQPMSGVTYLNVTTTGLPASVTTGSHTTTFSALNASGTSVGGVSIFVTHTTRNASGTSALPSSAVGYVIGFQNTGGMPNNFDYTIHVDGYCGYNPSIPGGPSPASCPPDPFLQIQIDQILQLVTLIQRQSVPFAYISGTLHSGLTGTGVVSVSGILGVLANASVPTPTSLLPGTPDVRLPIGRLNLATADGYTDRVELVTDSQVFFPRAAGVYTSIGYTLEPGVTLALTELVREP
jgi:hypothetical protein